jgi:hypothetical protein
MLDQVTIGWVRQVRGMLTDRFGCPPVHEIQVWLVVAEEMRPGQGVCVTSAAT